MGVQATIVYIACSCKNVILVGYKERYIGNKYHIVYVQCENLGVCRCYYTLGCSQVALSTRIWTYFEGVFS